VDGVERVMVLGILAVIVAILSFAWSAAESDAIPAVAADGGASSGMLPLRSQEARTDGVVIPPPKVLGLQGRLEDPDAVQRAQEAQRKWLLGGGKGPRPRSPAGASLLGSDPRAGMQAGQRLATQPGVERSQIMSPVSPGVQQQMPAWTGDPALGPGTAERALTTQPPLELQRRGPSAAKGEEFESGSDEPTFRIYTIREDDTLWGITYREVGAGDINAMMALIQQMNPSLDHANLHIGNTIKVPASVQLQLANRTPKQRVSDDGGRLYTVGEGDTLGVIALNELGSSRRWVEIYQLNKATIQDPERIHLGQRLLLPVE
jgi:nucleoid-associated protein YgaU